MNESLNNARDPNETKAASQPLWDALHDADIIQISSDPLARTVTLMLDIEHLRKFAKVSSGVTWRFVVHSVSMLLARRWEAWPGPRPELTAWAMPSSARWLRNTRRRHGQSQSLGVTLSGP